MRINNELVLEDHNHPLIEKYPLTSTSLSKRKLKMLKRYK
jgi:hypothetical protein